MPTMLKKGRETLYDEPLSARLPVQFTPKQLEELQAIAGKNKASDFVREAVLAKMRGEHRVLDVPEPAPDNALLIELEPTERDKLEALAKSLKYPDAVYLVQLLVSTSLEKSPLAVRDFLLGDFFGDLEAERRKVLEEAKEKQDAKINRKRAA